MRWDTQRPPRSSLLRCLIIACAIVSLAWAPDTPKQSDAPPTLELPDFHTLQQGTVTRILDENTLLISVEGRTLRYDMLGIASIPTRDKANIALAREALNRMMLGETVAIEHDPRGERNAANRLAAYFYRLPDHLPINLELVREGYTRHSPAGMSTHRSVFSYYESKAKELERGIWAPSNAQFTPPQPQAEPDQPTTSEPNQSSPATTTNSTVYITAYGSRYHRKDCPHLTDTARPTTRDKVKNTHKPCKTCKPDD